MSSSLRNYFSRLKSTSTQASALGAYVMSYGDRLETFRELTVADLAPHHVSFDSSLHRRAKDSQPDISAFLYAALRLPECINRVERVLIAPDEEVFAGAGYPGVSTWRGVESRARRRRYHYDGGTILAVFVHSISDLDDLVPTLCAFQVEWNKMHGLLHQSSLGKALARGDTVASLAGEQIRRALHLGRADWDLLQRVWPDDWDFKFAGLAAAPLSFTIQRLPLDVRYFDEAAARWWDDVAARFGINADEDRPIYIVSSNNHGLANLISGFAAQRERQIVDFLHEHNPEGLRRNWADDRRDPDRNSTDLLYYALRHYLDQVPAAAVEKLENEEAAGLTRYCPDTYPRIEAQKIELNRLSASRIDPLLNLPPALAQSRTWVINLEYPLGLAAKHLLSRACVRFKGLRGVFILGKSAALVGRLGDIMVPAQVHDGHTGNRYHFHNTISIRRITPYLRRIAAFDDQRCITVRGTFLHGRETLKTLIRDDFTGIEMEVGPYIGALYKHFTKTDPPFNSDLDLPLPRHFSLGVLLYTSDTPYNIRPSLLSTRLGLTGLEAAYAASRAILQRIFDLERR